VILFQSLTDSFVLELLQGIHDFRTDTFKLALYTSDATNDETTTAYTATNEVSGTGYVAGGQDLTVVPPVIVNGVAYPDFADEVFSTLTVSDIRSGLIYNSSQSNRSVCVLDFGRSFTKTAQDFTVTFPVADPTSAIIRVKRA
jgi:hypothetical protein